MSRTSSGGGFPRDRHSVHQLASKPFIYPSDTNWTGLNRPRESQPEPRTESEEPPKAVNTYIINNSTDHLCRSFNRNHNQRTATTRTKNWFWPFGANHVNIYGILDFPFDSQPAWTMFKLLLYFCRKQLFSAHYLPINQIQMMDRLQLKKRKCPYFFWLKQY